jgi:hypothetical protein
MSLENLYHRVSTEIARNVGKSIGTFQTFQKDPFGIIQTTIENSRLNPFAATWTQTQQVAKDCGVRLTYDTVADHPKLRKKAHLLFPGIPENEIYIVTTRYNDNPAALVRVDGIDEKISCVELKTI